MSLNVGDHHKMQPESASVVEYRWLPSKLYPLFQKEHISERVGFAQVLLIEKMEIFPHKIYLLAAAKQRVRSSYTCDKIRSRWLYPTLCFCFPTFSKRFLFQFPETFIIRTVILLEYICPWNDWLYRISNYRSILDRLVVSLNSSHIRKPIYFQ